MILLSGWCLAPFRSLIFDEIVKYALVGHQFLLNLHNKDLVVGYSKILIHKFNDTINFTKHFFTTVDVVGEFWCTIKIMLVAIPSLNTQSVTLTSCEKSCTICHLNKLWKMQWNLLCLSIVKYLCWSQWPMGQVPHPTPLV